VKTGGLAFQEPLLRTLPLAIVREQEPTGPSANSPSMTAPLPLAKTGAPASTGRTPSLANAPQALQGSFAKQTRMIASPTPASTMAFAVTRDPIPSPVIAPPLFFPGNDASCHWRTALSSPVRMGAFVTLIAGVVIVRESTL